MGKASKSRYHFARMTSFRTTSLGDFGCWPSLQRGGRAFALIALLVGCSSGAGPTANGGGGAGGRGGAAGTTASGGGGGGHGGAAGATATGGAGGTTGAGG